MVRIAEALLEREVLDGAEVKQLIDGESLPAFIRPAGPTSGDGTQHVIRPEGGRRVPGMVEGERPQPA
jgi:cell division protease FtsH